MGNYSDDAGSVRVDFFSQTSRSSEGQEVHKPSGKWYCTEAVKWTGPYLGTDEATGKVTLIHDAFAQSLADHFTKEKDPSPLAPVAQRRWRLEDMVAVCLEPYHEHAHPLMMKVSDAKQRWKEWNSK